MCGSDIFLGIIAILFPPLAVWVKRGICSADSIINIALCMLGFFPGLFHAWYIIAVTPDPTFEQIQDAEQGHVTYYYVHTGPRYTPVSSGEPQQSYGTVNSAPKSQAPEQQQPLIQHADAEQQAGPSDEVPPTYQQAVGDHKVQKP